jgi:hypothetical protein
MWQGRESLPPGFTLLVSSAAHLSVLKNAHLLNLPRVRVVPARADGAVDLEAFAAALRQCSSALVVLTLGTTMHGAYDDVAACIRLMDARWGGQWAPVGGGAAASAAAEEEGQGGSAGGAGGPACAGTRLNYYLHVDGALGGLILPFLRPDPPADGGPFPPTQAAAAAAHECEPVRNGHGACSARTWQPASPVGVGVRGGGGGAASAAAARQKRRRHWQHAAAVSGAATRGVHGAPVLPRTGPLPTPHQLLDAPCTGTASRCKPQPRADAAEGRPSAAPAAVYDGGLNGMVVDFATPEVCSMTLSLHKHLGVGAVCACFLSRAAFSSRLSVFQEVRPV